jgi:hypothetical protein
MPPKKRTQVSGGCNSSVLHLGASIAQALPALLHSTRWEPHCTKAGARPTVGGKRHETLTPASQIRARRTQSLHCSAQPHNGKSNTAQKRARGGQRPE